MLIAAAERAHCIVRLGMVSIAESGSAEAVWNGRWPRNQEKEDFDVIEVYMALRFFTWLGATLPRITRPVMPGAFANDAG